jgi:pSer/pThr/pTyr-binding forkhead associated (FHA) protein
MATADRTYFDRIAPVGVEFPEACPARTFLLEASEIRIGRGSPTRQPPLEIDLARAPEDPGISRLHAVLVRSPDGTYALMDVGSTKGTTLNDDQDPLPVNVLTRLRDGDRIHIGAWTTITLRAM